MSEFDFDSLSCDELREKRSRINSNIATDQREAQRLRSKIDAIDLKIAEKRDELEDVGGEPEPTSYSNVEQDQERRRRRQRKPRLRLPRIPTPVGVVVDVAAQVAAAAVKDKLDRVRIRDEISTLLREREPLLAAYSKRLELMNETIDGRARVVDAMRRKRCVGA